MYDRKQLIEKTIENIYALRHKIMSEMHLLFKELSLTHSQMMVLQIIKQNENTNLKSLAGILGITSSATTQIVNELVKKGFLVRKRNPDDRRALNLNLSDKSRLHFDSIRKKSFSDLYSLFDILSNDELLEYLRLSSKVIGEQAEGSGPGKDAPICSD